MSLNAAFILMKKGFFFDKIYEMGKNLFRFKEILYAFKLPRKKLYNFKQTTII